ncbi:tetratricopeptide repeat protein [bacterium]|nr:tetratricopeptide repeat protein [bacterium]
MTSRHTRTPATTSGCWSRASSRAAEPPPTPSNAANLTPWTKSNFLAVGKYEEAEAMHREALAMAKKLLGEEHP